MIKNIIRGANFGLQGMLDQAASGVVMGAFKGVGGFVSGTAKGIAGANKITNMTGIGRVTHNLGYGVGRTVAAPFNILMRGSGKSGKSAMDRLDDLGGTISRYGKDVFNAADNIVKRTTVDDAHRFSDLGVGLFGRRIKTGHAWALGGGAIALGAASGAENHRMQFGLKSAINGPMDYQGAAVAPGSITNTYTPLYGVNSHNVEGLGFALHNARNTGYL